MPRFLVLALCFAVALMFYPSFEKKPPTKPFYFAPPNMIKYFAFGFPDLYADILWMRLLQDIDFCNSTKGLPLYDGKTLYQCEKGWSYKMTEAITELAPRYLKPYEISASIMSVIMGDKQGAKKIYDKGLKHFPNNWKMHFNAGHHYLTELKDENTAAQLLTRAADLGGPYWLYGLAAKTYGKIGKLRLSQAILKEAIKKDVTGKYKNSLQQRLNIIEEQLKTSQKNP